jgi:hypothetical protein
VWQLVVVDAPGAARGAEPAVATKPVLELVGPVTRAAGLCQLVAA